MNLNAYVAAPRQRHKTKQTQRHEEAEYERQAELAALETADSNEDFIQQLHRLKECNLRSTREIERLYYAQVNNDHYRHDSAQNARYNFELMRVHRARVQAGESVVSTGDLQALMKPVSSDSSPVHEEENAHHNRLQPHVAWSDDGFDENSNPQGRSFSKNVNAHEEKVTRCSEEELEQVRIAEQEWASNMIESMWDKFDSKDAVAKERQREREAKAASTYRRPPSPKKKVIAKRQVTVPQPFFMTLRESGRKPTLSELALYEDLRNKAAIESVEVKPTVIRATPLPATTYLPLYDKIRTDERQRSAENRRKSMERLKSQERPFKFHERDRAKQYDRAHGPAPGNYRPKFKARPAPRHILDCDIPFEEKMALEDEERRARIRVRAEDMLASSALPRSMQSDRYTVSESRREVLASRESMSFMSEDHRFRPSIKGQMPDFEQLRRNFDSVLDRKKSVKSPTNVKPFKFHTDEVRRSTIDKVVRDIHEDELRLPEKRWPYVASRTKPISSAPDGMYASPIKHPRSTKSSELRNASVRSSLEKVRQKRRHEEEKDIEREKSDQVMKKVLSYKITAEKQSDIDARCEEKVRRFRRAQSEQERDFLRNKHEMLERVQQRPFLFEQHEQVNARRVAEKKFEHALEMAGLRSKDFDDMSAFTASAGDFTLDDTDLSKMCESFILDDHVQTSESASCDYDDDSEPPKSTSSHSESDLDIEYSIGEDSRFRVNDVTIDGTDEEV